MIKIWSCFRCGHEWASRKEGKPSRCPNHKCRSVNWFKPKARPKWVRKKWGRGRPSIYPWGTMRVGDIAVVPWHRDDSGYPDTQRNRGIENSARNYAKKNGVHMVINGMPSGLRVERTA